MNNNMAGRKYNNLRNYNIEQLRQAVSQSICFSDVCRILKLSICTYNFNRIRKLCELNNISIEHFDIKKSFRRNKTEWTEETVFKENSLLNRSGLRHQMKRFNKLSDKCEICGISEWMNKPITLEVHHINGNYTDNRLENLICLCPNCHSQTDSYRKSTKKI